MYNLTITIWNSDDVNENNLSPQKIVDNKAIVAGVNAKNAIHSPPDP